MIGRQEKGLSGLGTDGSDGLEDLTVDGALSKFGENPGEGRMPHIKPKMRKPHGDPVFVSKKAKGIIC